VDNATQEVVNAALATYTMAVEAHKAQVATMTQDYEEMVASATATMNALRYAGDVAAESLAEPPEPPTVARVVAENGEVFYAFNEQAYNQQKVIMDGMLDVIESL
jgi:hypothetical protein